MLGAELEETPGYSQRKLMGQARVPVKGPSGEVSGAEPAEGTAGQLAAKQVNAQQRTATVVSIELLGRAAAGDHGAFGEIYSLHKRRIYSLCLRMVGNPAEAEDLTQEAFLQLHRKIATFRGGIGVFNVASSAYDQRGADAPEEEGAATDLSGRGDGAYNGRAARPELWGG